MSTSHTADPAQALPPNLAHTAENAHTLALRTKQFSPAMWEELKRQGVTAEQIVSKMPHLCVIETAAELSRAGDRIAAAERAVRKRLRGAVRVRETRDEQIVAGQLRSLWKSSSSGKLGGECNNDTDVLADRLGTAVGTLLS